MPVKPLQERKLDAEVRCNQWLAAGNEAREEGLNAKAEDCYRKSQFWLDRFNLLAARSDRPPPSK